MGATDKSEIERIAILGASRGLGFELARAISDSMPHANFLLGARKIDRVGEFVGPETKITAEICVADFTRAADQDRVLNTLLQFRPSRIFYVAGGGPFGPFGKKEWKDHQWAYELNLLFPAKLLHWALSMNVSAQGLKQVIFVGSSIAENKPDPNAASYASAKHGLRGLVNTVSEETPPFDLRLFSPGYMDTDLLPPGSWPREQGVVASARSEAANLWQWAKSSLD